MSYNRHSRELAKNLAEDLKRLGHTVWFDNELSGGQTWWDQILGEVRACDAFTFLMDNRSLASAACHSEFAYAAALGKPILPVMIADGVADNLLPPELSRIQYVDYRNPDRDAAFKLARALTGLPPAPSLPEPLPEAPAVPSSYLGRLAQRIESGTDLSFDEQSRILLDLRKGLRDPESKVDAGVLLDKLRKRRDLWATIAEEIDGIRASPAPLPPAPKPDQIVKNIPKIDPPAPMGADGKIAAIVVWVVCVFGMFIAFTGIKVDADCIARGGSGSTCGGGPLWVKLVFVVSLLGFGLGGRLWTRR